MIGIIFALLLLMMLVGFLHLAIRLFFRVRCSIIHSLGHFSPTPSFTPTLTLHSLPWSLLPHSLIHSHPHPSLTHLVTSPQLPHSLPPSPLTHSLGHFSPTPSFTSTLTPHSLPWSLLPHSLVPFLIHSHPHPSLPHSLPHSPPPSPSHSLPPSPPPSRTPSITPSLPSSPPHFFTPSLPPSLPPSHTCHTHPQPDWQPLVLQLQALKINLKQHTLSCLGITTNALMQVRHWREKVAPLLCPVSKVS